MKNFKDIISENVITENEFKKIDKISSELNKIYKMIGNSKSDLDKFANKGLSKKLSKDLEKIIKRLDDDIEAAKWTAKNLNT